MQSKVTSNCCRFAKVCAQKNLSYLKFVKQCANFWICLQCHQSYFHKHLSKKCIWLLTEQVCSLSHLSFHSMKELMKCAVFVTIGICYVTIHIIVNNYLILAHFIGQRCSLTFKQWSQICAFFFVINDVLYVIIIIIVSIYLINCALWWTKMFIMLPKFVC